MSATVALLGELVLKARALAHLLQVLGMAGARGSEPLVYEGPGARRHAADAIGAPTRSRDSMLATVRRRERRMEGAGLQPR